MNSETTTAIGVLLRCLEAEGVEHIFGIPGGPLTPLYEGLNERKRIRHVLAKHEEGAAFMANGYARVGKRIGVCCATSGPGGTNALTGIAASYADSIPVLLITAQVATSTFGKGAAQDSSAFGVDIVEIYKPVTKLSASLVNPERTQDLVQRSIRTALSGRPGPVHLSIPADLAKRPAPYEPTTAARYRPQSHPLDLQGIQDAVRLLMEAERPCILAGHGVTLSQAAPELFDLAMKRRIPVATSPKAKGVFPENHPLSLGIFGFTGHHPRADAYLLSEGIDVLVVVGSSLGELVTHTWDERLQPSRALIHIDIDSSEIGKNYPADIGIVGDAKTILGELGQQISAACTDRPPLSEDPLRSLRQLVPRFINAHLLTSEATPIKPQRVIHEMQEALPPETKVFVDIGNSMCWAGHFFESKNPYTYILNLGLASMGHSIAGAIGGKLASPDTPVVVLGGDAAFAMNGMEVHTAAEYQLPITWIIMNNSGNGMVHQGEMILKGNDISASSYRVPIDICGLATALGALGLRASTPDEFRAALKEAMAYKGPAVIDVRIDPDEVPHALPLRAKTLGKFFAGKVDASPTSIRVPEIPWRKRR